MGKNRLDRPMDTKQPSDKPCWNEVLATVLTDIFPTDQNIEFVFDRLERAS
ncbi:hypothetical protein [Roseobacter denitrificans]|uniref:Uncharacterized protein n=1 Tax=Roseobacter denitrificans (strain ATCC 33942 / OCh 114) TaxID=375451 RepID=Q16BR1_ROSDO|nr:hypothetical protein [Roseobacter denitrificans]ABG30582.1 hypothetical protein RD1_0914 [Roseobacter denitrificans OCh 114]SFG19965.1 hypothetical protein SAMN05443635_109185 [Roseobacter denitrificans OCh 114]